MKQVDVFAHALADVYSSWVYVLITIFFTIVVFSLNLLVTNYAILLNNFSFQLIGALMLGSFLMLGVVGQLFLVVVSILSGLVLAMSIFLIRRQVIGGIGAGSSSFLVSIAAPSCPSCAIGLFSTIGLGGFLTILPFRGLELRFLALGILIFSLIYLSRKITTKVCIMGREVA